MTLSDADLERGLRDLGAHTGELPPPAPELVQTVRDRHRRQQRTRIQLAGAGLALALLFVGVPVISSAFDARNAEPASRTESTQPRDDRFLIDQPTRGSLADDEDWLAGIAALPVPLGQLGGLTDDSVDLRRTAFAAEVVDGRVALELLRLTNGSHVQAWFTGPWGARPDQMSLAALGWAGRSQPQALVDVQTPGLGPAVLTVVAFPGDEIEVLTGRTVSASGETQDRWVTLPTEDGAGAMAVDAVAGWFSSTTVVRLSGDDQRDLVALRVTDRAYQAPSPELAVVDPRGLRGTVDEAALQEAVRHLSTWYGSAMDQLRLTLLAGGPVPGSPQSTVLLGATFTSGATVAFAGAFVDEGETYPGMHLALTEAAPAGTPITDRIFAVVLQDTLTVSGPERGAAAEIYGADSELIATVPLVDGAGSAPAPAEEPQFVRIVDAAGALVLAGAATELAD
jgi:hypothetical protein